MTERIEDAQLPADAAPAGSHDALAERVGQAASMADFAARRADLGLSLEDVANQLKFAPRLIEALESGRFEKLPGRTFARGMLRGYAKLLKMDPAPYLAQMDPGIATQRATEDAVSLRTPIPFSEGGRHVNLVYTVLSVAILAAAAFFAVGWYLEKDAPPKLAFVAPAREVPASQPSVQDASPNPAPVDNAARQAGNSLPATTFASAGPVPVPETSQRADSAAGDATPSLAPGKRRIHMRFDKDSWVEIKARNGQTLLSQLNPAGTEKTIEGEPPFQLTIGNAHSVHLNYNDQPVDLKPHFKVDVARITLN